jgi:uncharacterized membrane protein YkvA (DUF1232 family)
MATKLLNSLKRQLDQLKMGTYTLYLAYRDSRVPWYGKILIFCAFGYAFSPIDKLLNSVPLVGYLDHLVLVPLGVVLAFKKMVPSVVWTDCRQVALNRTKSANWVDDSIVIFIWLLFVFLGVVSTMWIVRDWNLVLAEWSKWFVRFMSISKANAH